MSYVKLNEHYQNKVDESYDLESKIIEFIDDLCGNLDSNQAKRWFSIARTDIEKGFMAFRKAITHKMKSEEMAKKMIYETHLDRLEQQSVPSV